MQKKNLAVIFLLVVIIVSVVTVTYYIRSTARDRAQNEANKTLFSEDTQAMFLDKTSNPISLDTYKDTILVVNVWASWSPYPAIEFPLLNELAEQFKDSGVKFLVMNRKESQPQIERYLSTLPAYDNLEHIVDVNDFFYSGIDGYAMPETVIYNAQGKIIRHIRGVVVKEELEASLNQIITEEN